MNALWKFWRENLSKTARYCIKKIPSQVSGNWSDTRNQSQKQYLLQVAIPHHCPSHQTHYKGSRRRTREQSKRSFSCSLALDISLLPPRIQLSSFIFIASIILPRNLPEEGNWPKRRGYSSNTGRQERISNALWQSWKMSGHIYCPPRPFICTLTR